MASNERDNIRKQIFSGKSSKFKSETIEFFGATVEIRQPSLKTILDARNVEDEGKASVMMLIDHCYIPGTDDRVFEDADLDNLMAMPFGDDLAAANKVLSRLTGIDVDKAEKNFLSPPITGTSSN